MVIESQKARIQGVFQVGMIPSRHRQTDLRARRGRIYVALTPNPSSGHQMPRIFPHPPYGPSALAPRLPPVNFPSLCLLILHFSIGARIDTRPYIYRLHQFCLYLSSINHARLICVQIEGVLLPALRIIIDLTGQAGDPVGSVGPALPCF